MLVTPSAKSAPILVVIAANACSPAVVEWTRLRRRVAIATAVARHRLLFLVHGAFGIGQIVVEIFHLEINDD